MAGIKKSKAITEAVPKAKKPKKELENDDRILIEMQLQPQGYFKNRILYYTSRMIQDQGEGNKGDEWGYALKKVYSVNIVNFRRESKKTDRYISYVQLMDKKTHRIFSDRLTLIFLEIPRFNKEVHELSDSIEEWMFVLKNLARLNDLPHELRTRYFESLFHKAEIAKLSKEKRKEYNQSVKNLLDMNALIAEKNREIAALQKENAELRQRLGVITKMNTPVKSTRTVNTRTKKRFIADS